MLAVLALVCFVVALVLHVLGVNSSSVDLVPAFVIAGAGLVAGHLAFPRPKRP